MANYDYNKANRQKGVSDIEREAFPVMYDPTGFNYLKKVYTIDSPSVIFTGDGTKDSNLRAEVNFDSFDGKIAIRIENQDEGIDLSGNGTDDAPLKAKVKISSALDNALTYSDGLYVPISEHPIAGIEDTDSVDLDVTGAILKAYVRISSGEGNQLTQNSDGLYVAVPEQIVDGVKDTATISMSLDDKKISGEVRISSAEENILDQKEDGLFVKNEVPETTSADEGKFLGFSESGVIGWFAIPAPEVDGVEDTATIKMDVADKKISGSVKISSGEGNIISAEDDGLYASVPADQNDKVKVSSADEVAGYLGDKIGQGDGISVIESNGKLVIASTAEEYISDSANTDTIDIHVEDGSLTADVNPSGLSGQIAISADNSQTIEASGDGTNENPLVMEIVEGSLDGKVGIYHDNYNEYNVQFSGSGKAGDPLLGSVDLSDYMTDVETDATDTATILGDGTTGNELKVDVKVSTAEGNRLEVVTEQGYEGLFVGAELPLATTADEGKFLGVNSSGSLEYMGVEIPESVFAKSAETGTYKVVNPSSANCNGYDFLGVINNGGTYIGSKISGVTVTHYADVEYDMPWSGTTTAADNCKSITMKGNYYGTKYMRTLILPYMSADMKTINHSLMILDRTDGGATITNVVGKETSAFLSRSDMNFGTDMQYGKIGISFGHYGSVAPDYSSEFSYGKGYLKWQSSRLELYSSGRSYVGTTGLSESLLVTKGLSHFKDYVMFEGQIHSGNILNCRKIIVGGPDKPGSATNYYCDGIVYGYGETSARDALRTQGKDPGRQYYTTDDNRVNVYNSTSSGWDKVAYLTDLTVFMSNPMTNDGDLIVGGTDGEPEVLPIGNVGDVLTIGSSGIEWGPGGSGTAWYLGAYATSARPTASDGQYIFDTTLRYPVWSWNGDWINASGAVV